MEKRIITWLRGRICTAFIQDGSLVELTLEDEDCSVLNRIYVGRVQKVVPGINAAFIDMGDGVGYYSLTENRSHLFTDRNRKEGPLRQGDEILVQILSLIHICYLSDRSGSSRLDDRALS